MTLRTPNTHSGVTDYFLSEIVDIPSFPAVIGFNRIVAGYLQGRCRLEFKPVVLPAR